tara:strand:+ start:1010 stop:1186 length:177 start_codon:yes stop_codon:yes gene_type:complete
MDIKDAQYKKPEGETEPSSIYAVINGLKCSVPLAEGNTEYDEIMRQVADKKLTIKEAD